MRVLISKAFLFYIVVKSYNNSYYVSFFVTVINTYHTIFNTNNSMVIQYCQYDFRKKKSSLSKTITSFQFLNVYCFSYTCMVCLHY